MGFDKPDLGFVVHLGAPSSPVAYYQQVGRAGPRQRERRRAAAARHRGPRRSGTTSRPRRCPTRSARGASSTSCPDAPLSTPALEARVDIRRTPLELLLKVLDVDGAVRRVQGGWVATGEPWAYDAERYGRIAAEREAEQQHMIDYEQTDGCRMEFLQRSLDDETAAPCGRCDNCAGAWYPARARRRRGRRRPRGALDRVGVPDRAPARMADRRRPARRPGEGPHRTRRAGRRGPRARPPHRPRLGRHAARAVRRRRARCSRDAAGARGVRARARRLGLGRAPGRRRRDAVAVASAARRLARPRARRGRPPPLPRRARPRRRRPDRAARRQQRVPARRGLGAVQRRRRSTCRRAACCSSTTRPTAAGRSRSPPAPSAGRARPRCCRSCSRCAAERPPPVE